MSLSNTRRSSRTSITSTGRRLTRILLKNSLSAASTRTSLGSVKTPRTGSILPDWNILGEHDYEMTREIMRDLIEEIQIDKPWIGFDQIFLDQDDVIGCLLRIFFHYADEVHGNQRITRENMVKLLDESEIFTEQYSISDFNLDWNYLRKQMIKKKIYERKMKTFDFCGFIQLIDLLKNRLYQSKDAILKKIIGPQIYDDIIRLKEIRNKSQLGVLPSIDTLIDLHNQTQMKINDQRKTKKKKKKRNKKKRKVSKVRRGKKGKPKSKPTVNLPPSPPTNEPVSKDKVLPKEVIQLKTLPIFEPWIKRDEVDKDLFNKLFQLFHLASQQFQHGLIKQSIFIQWLRASHAIPQTISWNLIGIDHQYIPFHLSCVEGILSGVLARNINGNLSKLGVDTFDWNGFVDCIRILAKEIPLPFNDLIRKLLIADEFAFQKWQAETEYIPEEGSSKKINRLWDGKKVLAAVNIMREVVEDSRKLHLTEDERKRLRSLYKEFATFAYRRQSAHLEARLTNSVLSNWMRECRLFDEKYTVNELDKDFISILGDFTLNGLYSQGTRDLDFDGFLVLIQTIAAHKHIRADDLVQMIFAGPRSPLQKTSEFNEHMDRTKIQTSQGI